MGNQQLHKRLSLEQVKTILENYFAKEIKAKKARELLGLKKSQFHNLASLYETNPDNFNIDYKRTEPTRKLGATTEEKILIELKSEKELIDNKDIAIKYYNYSAVRDILKDKYKITVFVPTIIARAKDNKYYIEKSERKIHDHEVLTNCIGELIQGDSSHHLWSPYMPEKLYLITYLDDYSRLILYADLMESETVWTHICAVKSMFLRYGCPLKIYVDQHPIFRYVKDRDQNRPWHYFTKFTDEVTPQWKQTVQACKVEVIYALSPQAKGKIERPYRWLQDRLVRTAAKEHLTTIEQLRKALVELVNAYNTRWVHTTTNEIPIIRFEKAIKENKTLFRPLKVEAPYQDLNDIFCLKDQRVVDAYRKISLNGVELKVPGGIPRQTVDLKIIPDYEKGLAEIRFWQKNFLLGKTVVPIANFQNLRF